MSILIVDDDKLTCSMYAEFISKVPQVSQIITTTSAMDGIRILHERFDIKTIILDMNMRDLNGFEFLKNIALNDYLLKIPVIALSTDESLEKRAMQSGAYLFLEKPVRKSELENAISETTILLA